MKRRVFLGGSLVLPPLLLRGEAILVRRAQFEEGGDWLLMTLDLPELFPARDREALDSIDSGFATVVRYDLELHRLGLTGPQKLIALEARIQYDLWNQRYVVSGYADGQRTTRRTFAGRADAIRAVTKLQRIRIAKTADLGRGANGPYYYVVVVARRNPVDPATVAGLDPATRARGSDVRWFARLLDFLADRAPDAEETLSVRTNPFYLLPR